MSADPGSRDLQFAVDKPREDTMTRTRSILGMLLLGALGVCALWVANASALTMHECGEAFEGTGKSYTDAACSIESKEGQFKTVPVSGEPELEGVLTPTTAGGDLTTGEGAGTHVVLHTQLSGIDWRITCTGLSTPGANARNNAGSVIGTSRTRFTGCAFEGSSKKIKESCTVAETLEMVELLLATEGDKVMYKPREGEQLIRISVSSAPGKTCPSFFVGEKSLTGTIKGVAASPTALEFTSASGSELSMVGVSVQFTAVIHYTTKGTSTPIALETP